MNTTKYSVNFIDETAGTDEPIALMSNKVNPHAFHLFCNACVDDYRTQRCYVVDMETGEIVFDTDDDEEDYSDIYEPFDGQYDELNYDPYMGCDYYETESFDEGW